MNQRDAEPAIRNQLGRFSPNRDVASLVVLWGCFSLATFLFSCAPPSRGETPAQPIAFNHSVHVGRGFECTRCHRGAERAKHAGLPALETCASCHRWVISEHPEVKKVVTAYENAQPILWRKVNSIRPLAMVHFNHRAHARAEVGCSTCHGDVASMTVAEPVINTANMGWCLDCHRARDASIDCLVCHY